MAKATGTTKAKTTAKKATAKTSAKKPAAKKAAAAPKTKVGAKAAAEKLSTEPETVVAPPELQEIANERWAIVGKLSLANAEVNKVKEELKTKNQELLDAGAVVGMIFEDENGDPMQFTHNVKPSKAYSKIIKAFTEKHPEFAEEFAQLEVEFTSENQQEPNFKAA
jgi:hypothetical protein